MNNVVIGIQARSTSTRFPNKVLELLGGKPILSHVIQSCKESAEHLNQFARANKCTINVVLLIPEGDKLRDIYKSILPIQEGPENDVLKRYMLMCDNYAADSVVRITSDCPLIPSPVITKVIKAGVMKNHDYCSNVDEETRTAYDGKDCEFISKKAMKWLNETAVHEDDRQHVTTLIRRERPKWAHMGFVIDYLDWSDFKLSVDTPEDLERVREFHKRFTDKYERAKQIYGKSNVHKF